MTKISKFNESVIQLLCEKLKRFSATRDQKLDLVVCTEIYQTIFDTLVEVFQTSNVKLSNESVNYLAQQYYDGVTINGQEDALDPNIFTQRAKLENIETKQLALLAVMLNHTDFAIPIIYEIKKRS